MVQNIRKCKGEEAVYRNYYLSIMYTNGIAFWSKLWAPNKKKESKIGEFHRQGETRSAAQSPHKLCNTPLANNKKMRQKYMK